MVHCIALVRTESENLFVVDISAVARLRRVQSRRESNFLKRALAASLATEGFRVRPWNANVWVFPPHEMALWLHNGPCMSTGPQRGVHVDLHTEPNKMFLKLYAASEPNLVKIF